MPRSGTRLWLTAALFVAFALIVVLLYQHLRAGHIQAAEGRLEYDAGRFDLAEAAYQRATRGRGPRLAWGGAGPGGRTRDRGLRSARRG